MRLSLFSSKQCIIKQLLDSVFVISRIIKVKVSVSVSVRLVFGCYLDLDYRIPDISQKPHPIIVYKLSCSSLFRAQT